MGVSLFLSACVTLDDHRVRTEFFNTVPRCQTARECELKWAAARRWVLDNAGMKIQHITSDFIETYNPPPHSTELLAVRVVKEPTGDEGYQIMVTVWCNNMFGCVPDKWQAALNFNQYVNAAGQ